MKRIVLIIGSVAAALFSGPALAEASAKYDIDILDLTDVSVVPEDAYLDIDKMIFELENIVVEADAALTAPRRPGADTDAVEFYMSMLKPGYLWEDRAHSPRTSPSQPGLNGLAAALSQRRCPSGLG